LADAIGPDLSGRGGFVRFAGRSDRSPLLLLTRLLLLSLLLLLLLSSTGSGLECGVGWQDEPVAQSEEFDGGVVECDGALIDDCLCA
jgi:hypothetical protein